MIRSKGQDEIPEAIREQLDVLLESGGEGLDIGYLKYIQDKPEPKYFPLVETGLRSKKIERVIPAAYLAVSWKLKEFAPAQKP
ncbi:hypothetical protein LEP1GSC060_3599 [Leptospira weilii serovar Ranarum str. ICFT]|uniref:Uncharacterized protein n=1 Tax=Leptospira weilii serovar Ranarum str. ICFT TaxID=1218598 RepID=N1WG15_9LEPT|nr:hypothetical protein LEP1GSC060_3599 [Leptospira weilii serovar Ranarum str. ICFT]